MQVKLWPNRLGADVTSGRLRIEVWEHGGCRRLVADDSITGFSGTHYNRVPRGTFEEMAAAAVESWNTRRHEWKECEAS